MRHANNSILALDLGTQCGWALYADGSVKSGTFDLLPMKGQGPGVRFLKFRRELLPNFRTVREVYYEEVRRHEGTHAAHIYGGLWAHLVAWCEENSIPCHPLEVAQIKKHVTGKGNANKLMMIAAMKQRGYNPEDDNEADALAILSFARKQRSL